MNDNRLLACARLVRGSRAADVGTDHGYLPVYLVQNGICESALACDINEKPLASARENIEKAGLSDKIGVYLSDGLGSVPCEGITDVIVAGMGGELIADIISRADWIKQRRVNLVLQPMTKWDHLREFLYTGGFEVTSELPCQEGKFVYSVMQAAYTGTKPPYDCDLRYLYCGIVTPDTEAGRAYYLRQAQRLEAVGRGLLHAPDGSAAAQEHLALAQKLRELVL